MFRKVGALLAFLSFVSIEAQEVKDYNYIIIPENFTGFEKNKYQLKNRLNHFLKQKKYTVVSFNQQNWPDELKNDPCLGLIADIKKVKSITTNKIEIEFSNCSKQVVETIEATSKIKDFEPGFQEAVEIAVNKLSVSEPTVKSKISDSQFKQINFNESPRSNEIIVFERSTTNNSFTDGNNSYQRINIENGNFLLMLEKNNQIVATFEPTLKKGIYRVIISTNGTKYASIGYVNGNTISYEVLENITWKEVVLTEKK